MCNTIATLFILTVGFFEQRFQRRLGSLSQMSERLNRLTGYLRIAIIDRFDQLVDCASRFRTKPSQRVRRITPGVSVAVLKIVNQRLKRRFVAVLRIFLRGKSRREQKKRQKE